MSDKPSLRALRELHEKATPGPWVAESDDTPNRCAGITGPTQYDDAAYSGDIVVTDSGVYPPRMPDATLIVALRNALPALLAIAEAARAWADEPYYPKEQENFHSQMLRHSGRAKALRATLALVEE